MKPIVTTLVLIGSAAVVLWYGNTLNSWVLGGLIGGLAALLLSIPISLMLFSYLSHRHDEPLRGEMSQEALSAEAYSYGNTRVRVTESIYDVEGRALPTDPVVSARSEVYAQGMRQQQKGRLAAKGKDTSERRITKSMKYPGLPIDSSARSRHQSAALHTARLEAGRQWRDDLD